MTNHVKVLTEVVTSLESGARPKGGVNGDGDIPSLGAEHLSDDGGFNFKKIKRISNHFFSSMKSGHIQTNDILIVKDGATTGKVSFVGGQFPFKKATVNEHVFILRVNKEIACPVYVHHYLRTQKGKEQILKDFRGATVGGISRSFVDKVQIKLPPLAEQQRIAAILDKAEEIRRKREQAIEKLNQLAQSTFEEMFVINASAKDATRPVKEICEFKYGKSLPSSQREPGPFRVYGSNGVVGMHSAPITDGETIIIGRKGSYGEINCSEDSCYPIDTTFYVDRTATSHNLTWLIYALSQLKLNTMNKSAAVPGLSRDDAYRQVVRVPNLTRQRAFEDKVKAIELLKSLAKAHVEQFKKASASLQHQAFSTGFDA